MYSDQGSGKAGHSGGMASKGGASSGGFRRRDVKSRTMQKYTVFDEDVGSRYDYEDEEPLITRRASAAQGRTGTGSYQSQLPVRIYTRPQPHQTQQARTDSRLARQVAGRRDIVHRITVRNATQPAKEIHRILMMLGEAVDNFRPIAPRINIVNIEFYLMNQEDADAVKSMSMRISDKSGKRLSIAALRVPAPWEQLRPEVKQAIEEAVKGRYMANLNSMDLSDFTMDQNFVKTSPPLYCPLFNNAVLVQVSNIIARDYGQIRGLSLKGNRLRSLDYSATLVYSAQKVIELDLSSNALTRMEQLEVLRGWAIERLHLENNELVSKYTDDARAYDIAVHEVFPRVNYLDGMPVIPQPFQLDSDELLTNTASLLPYRNGYYAGDETLRQLVENFLIEYYSLYDGEKGDETRKKLLHAYDDNAVFTHTIQFLPDGLKPPKGDEEAFGNYIRSSHNILNESKWMNYRDKIIYRGAMDIAVALSKLPLSKHIKESFILDFNLISSNVVSFTLQGILRDGRDAFDPTGDCKFFVRNFIVVPRGDGTLAIVSDMLGLTPVGVERMERYNSLLKKAAAEKISDQMSLLPSSSNSMMNGTVTMPPPPPTPQPVNVLSSQEIPMAVPASQPLIPTATAPPTAPTYDVNDPVIQQAMVKQFSDISGMKEEWSQKCLFDMNWNFEAAGQVFNEMKDKNMIPAEAFK